LRRWVLAVSLAIPILCLASLAASSGGGIVFRGVEINGVVVSGALSYIALAPSGIYAVNGSQTMSASIMGAAIVYPTFVDGYLSRATIVVESCASMVLSPVEKGYVPICNASCVANPPLLTVVATRPGIYTIEMVPQIYVVAQSLTSPPVILGIIAAIIVVVAVLARARRGAIARY